VLNCLLKQVIEIKVERRMKVMEKLGRRLKQLADDLN
jgi:hypothetical protein